MTNPRIALVVHAFYAEEFDEILSISEGVADFTKLFVTVCPEREQDIRVVLVRRQREALVKVVENRGRDVLPFLRILPDVKQEGFDLLVKLHTKRSPHKRRGVKWRKLLINQLLKRNLLLKVEAAFNADPFLAFVGTYQHYVRLDKFIGGNQKNMQKLAQHFSLRPDQLTEAGFFAGTMFIARIRALQGLMDLGFTSDEFEEEALQLDGTLAHALERAMTFGALAQGMRITTIDKLACDGVPLQVLDTTSAGKIERFLRGVGRAMERRVRFGLRGKTRDQREF